MGTGVIRVPRDWSVDLEATPVMGQVDEQRVTDDWSTSTNDSRPTVDAAAPTGNPPRLIVRGTIMMGRLVVRS
jgi:hypothetical protein